MAANKTIGNIPLGEKMNLSIAEASVYTGIGQVTLRKWLREPDCPFLIWVGPKKMLIRRQELEDYIRSKTVFCKLCLNGMPVPLLRNGYFHF